MGALTGWQRRGILAVALLLVVPHAFACSSAPAKMSRAQVERAARDAYARASAVVDAEVDMPMEGGAGRGVMPMAVLRVTRRYKGTGSTSASLIPMVYYSSCDIALTRKGERVRILLTGGPDLFRAIQWANGPAADRVEAQAEFNAEIDRLAGAPRPAGFAVFPGAIDPPPALATDAEEKAWASQSPAPSRFIPRSFRMPEVPWAYALAAIGVLLAFLAGLLIGRRQATRRAEAG